MSRKKIIFLTGASGFIGRHFLKDLDYNKYDCIALTRNKSNIINPNPQTEILEGDIMNISKYSEVLSKCDYFVNIAAEKTLESEMDKINILGTEAILREIIKYPQLKLIHISTSGIYGIKNHNQEEICEDSEVFPDNKYETTKLKAEKLIIDFCRQIPFKYVILRLSNVFGEFEKTNKLLNLFKSLYKNHFIYLDKEAKLNYVYVKDINDIVFKFIEQDLINNSAYNINASCSIYEFIEQTKHLLNINYKTFTLPAYLKFFVFILSKIFNVLPKRYRLIDSIKYNELTNKKIYSTYKINSIFELNEKESLFKGVENLIKYYRDNQLL